MKNDREKTEEPIIMEFSRQEALVLFDYLSRGRDQKAWSTEHYAEEKVLDAILGILEKSLIEPFQSEYKQLVENARINVQGEDELI